MTTRRSTLLILPILCVHLILLQLTRFTLWPEMVTYPFLINHGFLLYKDLINPYPPLLSSVLAVFTRVFGYSPNNYKLLTWSLILTIDVLIYHLAGKIFKSNRNALVSTAIFALLSIPFGVNGLWFDLVQTPLVIISVFLLYKYLDDKSQTKLIFWTLLSLTIGFFIKQQIIWLVIWLASVVILKSRYKLKSLSRKLHLFLLPFVLIIAVCLFISKSQGTAKDFLFWVFYFPFFKASGMPGYISLPSPRELLVTMSIFLLFIPTLLKRRFDEIFFVLSGIILSTFAYPRFDYFHLIPSVAVLSLAAGPNIKNLAKSNLLTKSTILILGLFLLVFTGRFIIRNPNNQARFFEDDIYRGAANLKSITSLSDVIYMQNNPGQILVLANRLPPKPWADEFPWYLELPGEQEKIIDAIILQNPKYVVFKPYDNGQVYDLGVYRPAKVADYLDSHYQNLTQISDTLWLKARKE